MKPSTSALVIAVLTGLVLLALPRSAGAATISVNTPSMTEANDVLCGLAEAVKAVNNQAPYFGCPAGNGNADKIMVPPGTYQTNTAMTVTRSVIIEGNGSGNTFIESGGTWALAIRNGSNSTLTLKNLMVRKLATQSLPVKGLWIQGLGKLVLDTVRVGNFNSGGIVLDGPGAVADIKESRVSDNTGGGIRVTKGLVTILRSTISGNQGSGIVNEGGNGVESKVSIDSSIIENNSGTYGGGIRNGLTNQGVETRLTLQHSTVRSNQAQLDGGGIYSLGQPDITNTTISGNTARSGAGMYHAGAESHLHFCTVAYNTATQSGGGLYLAGGQKIITRNIVANNSAPTGPDVRNAVAINDGSYDLIENPTGSIGWDSTTLTWIDPQVAPLQNVGGFGSIHPLLTGSPAIDRIPLAAGGDILDGRSSKRPQNGDDGQGRDGYDMGAFEQGPLETEILFVAQKSDDVHTVITGNPFFSGNQGTVLQANAAGDYVTYRVQVVETGLYRVQVAIYRTPISGQFQLAWSGSEWAPPEGWTNIGTPQDAYSSGTGTVLLTLSNGINLMAGTRFFRFLITGKNAQSTGFLIHPDYVRLTKL